MTHRERKMTKKGRLYALDCKQKELRSRSKTLKALSEHVRPQLVGEADSLTVRAEHSAWLEQFETLFQVQEECLKLCSTEKEKNQQQSVFDALICEHKLLKADFEQWFAKNPAVDVKDSVSQISKGSSSASKISLAKAVEQQRKAEFVARANALKEKRKLEEAKLKLKLDEEEFEIETEIKVSEARAKVLECLELEKQSSVGENDCTKSIAFQVQADEHPMEESPSTLDPHAPAFKPAAQAYSPLDDVQADSDLRSVTRELRKPTVEITKFSGNVLDYTRFLRQFHARVEVNTDSYEEKMTYLLQFTVGEAHDIALAYSHIDAKRGFEAVLAEFNERYGDANEIAQAYVKRALDWPIVKMDNAKALDDYSIFLRECQYAVEETQAVGILEYTENMKLLVKKLPCHLHDKWRTLVYEKRLKKQPVKFSCLVEFVRKEARKANDPVFGRDVMSSQSSKQSVPSKLHGKQTRFGQKSLATSVSGSEHDDACAAEVTKSNNSAMSANENSVNSDAVSSMPCLFCKKSEHSLLKCKAFLEKGLLDRFALLRSHRFCFGCLKRGHQKKDCRNKLICAHCKKFHPTILHVNVNREESERDACNERKSSKSSAVSGAGHMGAGDRGKNALPIVAVRVVAGSRSVCTYAFLDSGSTSSFMTENLMRSLGVTGSKRQMDLRTMSNHQLVTGYEVAGLQASSLDGNASIKLPIVFTQPELPVSKCDLLTAKSVSKWHYLRDVPLSVGSIDADVGLLLGVDVPKALEPWDVVRSEENGPFAVRTIFGWVINGPLDVSSSGSPGQSGSSSAVRLGFCNRIKLSNLEHQLQDQFNHDFSERVIDDIEEHSQNDKLFLKKLEESALFESGHYSLKLPFESDCVSLPNNRKQAEQRMTLLARKLERDKDYASEYRQFVDGLFEKGYAVRVPADQLESEVENSGKVWYIPHHGVRHPRKHKLRVVFDCAARYKGSCLNDELLAGPNLTNSLVGVLLRFRLEEVAIMGDVEAMFYQVRVGSQDQNFLRFLWWEDGNTEKRLLEYQMVVHLFGAKSSPGCANFALRKTATDLEGTFDQEVIRTVLRSFYVDDCLKSVPSVDRAVELLKDVKTLLSQGGFHIRQWISNSKELVDSVPVLERAKKVMDLDLNQDVLPIERALGVRWCAESDTLRAFVDIPQRPPTRRGILSMVSSVYDPLGLLSPFILRAKQILQELSRIGLGWDVQIPDSLFSQWNTWVHELRTLEDWFVPRCYKPVGFGKVTAAQLHHFSDASEVGYGVASYLVMQNDVEARTCCLVSGKARVAPLKKTTIPRLELTAATVAVRTDKMLTTELDDLPFLPSQFWTDSQAVLRYIHNKSNRFKTFVANRLAVIHDGSSPVQWHYVSTSINPADIASRGQSAEQMSSDCWLTGPSFLVKDEIDWPGIPESVMKDESFDPEVKKEKTVGAVVSNADSLECSDVVSRLIKRYSSWQSLRRSVAWILRLKSALLAKVRKQGSKELIVDTSPLTVQDIQAAEKALLVYDQHRFYVKEIEALNAGLTHVSRQSSIRKLNPVFQDGLLRVGGRLNLSKLSEEAKHPVILSKCSDLSRLVIVDVHNSLFHSGRNHMLSRLRQKFWIVQAPSAIRRVIRECVVCKKQKAKVCEQKMSDLPVDRVSFDDPPFTSVGVDLFGPFEVKRGRSVLKRYGVIFTCLAIRAVHLEVADSFDTSSFICALRRFISRRGQVKRLRSDNGTNFVGANRYLKDAIAVWNNAQVSSFLLQRNIEWIFNPPAGSHHGGVYERMIGSVRKVLNSVVKQHRLDEEGLRTLFCEIEAILNDRPITKNPDQPDDLEALTPNQLLLMKAKPTPPPGLFDQKDIYSRRRWRQVQYLSDLFWHRWTKEYLPLLHERQKWNEIKRNLCIDDVVLVVDDRMPRNSWPLGRVVEVLPDRNGLVRQVKVKTAYSELLRPIDKLCLILECE